MSQENKGPDVVPGIAPDRDEVASYRRGQETGARARPQQNSFNAWLLFVTFILVLLMAAGGYVLYVMRENLRETGELLVASREQISRLENRLSTTGQDFARAGSAVEERLSTNESEIRKLWGVSHDRNRKAIAQNTALLAGLGDRLDEVSRQATAVQAAMDRQTEGFQRLEKVFDESRQEFLLQSEGLQADMGVLLGDGTQRAEELAAVKRLLTELETRSADFNESIEAINQHRRQLSRQLRDLERELSLLQAEASN